MILISGGEGFIGRYICEEFIKSKREDFLSLDLNKNMYLNLDDYRFVNCDITDYGQLEDIFINNKITEVIHLATAQSEVMDEDPLKETEINLNGSINLFKLCTKYKIKKFIYASSVKVYGTKNINELIDESEGIGSESIYGLSKRYIEVLGKNVFDMSKIDFVSLRIPIVIGKGAVCNFSNWQNDIIEKLDTDRLFSINIPYKKDEYIPLIHVADLAKIFIKIVNKKKPNKSIYNSPCDHLKISYLCNKVSNRNSNISFQFGEQKVIGFPRFIDSSLYKNEFGEVHTKVKEYIIDEL